MLSGRPSTARAASLSASARVGWACTERPISSALAENSIASAASAITSDACGPRIWMPTTLSAIVFAEADTGELGVRVDHVRDRVVVHMAGHARHALDRGDSLVLGLVREHQARDDVADSVDPGHAGGE